MPTTVARAEADPAIPGRDAPIAFGLESLPPLDTTSAMPLYTQLAERLSAPIQANHAALVGHALPTELECMAYFGVSRPTVRQAMAQLVSMGLVARGRGRGTFVAPERLNHDVSLAFEDEMRAAHRTVRFQTLSRAEIAAPAAVAARLNLPAGERVEHIERLRFLDDEVFAFEQRYLPLSVARHVTARMLEEMAIISLLTEAMGQSPARITNTVRCIPTEARIARALGVPGRTPLLHTEHTYFAPSGAPVLHGTVWFNGERFQFTLDSPIQAGPRG
ncbi:GntR family transcriptional regulator [Pararoseomonas indoligenes]|uniref:GntR family transcriptional regulator n=1 Tax=Roseomonas indoligenes TaxID=2820811 RepID=A0A940N7Y7_9PROT|nr:GntR family transcriptional regulator [Pararoseomonas indoligenes]MBP0495727.1 GntR family transcriptional regulator [Pararoseomonas indoligenes]